MRVKAPWNCNGFGGQDRPTHPPTECLTGFVDEAKIHHDFKPDVPNGEAYPVDSGSKA